MVRGARPEDWFSKTMYIDEYVVAIPLWDIIHLFRTHIVFDATIWRVTSLVERAPFLVLQRDFTCRNTGSFCRESKCTRYCGSKGSRMTWGQRDLAISCCLKRKGWGEATCKHFPWHSPPHWLLMIPKFEKITKGCIGLIYQSRLQMITQLWKTQTKTEMCRTTNVSYN